MRQHSRDNAPGRAGKWIAAALMTAALPAWALLGMAVRFPDLVMEKVDPGTVLNLRQDSNIPYVVINRTDGPIDVSVAPEAPSGKGIKEGYEPVPQPGWVRIIPNKFHLAQGESASADVILSVPGDPALVGRHFQADLHARTVGTGFLAVGVLNTLRFSVGSLGPSSLKNEKALKTLENMDLELTPESLILEAAPLGRSVPFKQFKVGPLKVTNRGAEPVRLKLTSVSVDNNLKRPDYDPAPDPAWLTVKPAVVKVKPNRVEEAELFLNIPDVPENRGRKFMFVVRGELESMGIPLAIHSRVYVTTAGEARR